MNDNFISIPAKGAIVRDLTGATITVDLVNSIGEKFHFGEIKLISIREVYDTDPDEKRIVADVLLYGAILPVSIEEEEMMAVECAEIATWLCDAEAKHKPDCMYLQISNSASSGNGFPEQEGDSCTCGLFAAESDLPFSEQPSAEEARNADMELWAQEWRDTYRSILP